MATNPLMNKYMRYTRHTEMPPQFRRWGILSAVAAMLGRRCYFKFGRLKTYPHMYILLSGLPATRKSTAINTSRDLVVKSGYKAFAPAGSSREKFLEDLQIGFANSIRKANEEVDDFFADVSMQDSPCYICAGEFIDFIGTRDVPFISTLTNLWDVRDEPYEERFKKSNSILIYNPIINLLGGVTHDTMAMAMPANIMGHGFVSRIIMVHADPVVERITFPPDVDHVLEEEIVSMLQEVREMKGVFTPDAAAADLIDKIYKRAKPPQDARLQAYFGRRLDHMLKVCMACAAMRGTYTITCDIVEEANTILTFTEDSMSQALGELGDNRNARAAQDIMNILSGANAPVSGDALFKGVIQNVDKFMHFQEILISLEKAGKIEHSIVNSIPYYILVRGRDNSTTIAFNKERWLEEFQDDPK